METRLAPKNPILIMETKKTAENHGNEFPTLLAFSLPADKLGKPE